MKNQLLLTFVMTLSFGFILNASAFSESFDGPIGDTSSIFRIKKDSTKKLNSAILNRWYFYQKNKIRNDEYKNRLNQIQRHQDGKKLISVNEESTIMNRSGELEFSPFYGQIRAGSRSSINAPNNAKRNFRARAINYYIQGGNAGTDVLQSNVILSSEHTIPQIPFSLKREKKQAIDFSITKPVRDIQKMVMKTIDQVPTGQQKTTFHRGDSNRNFFHPFMFGTNQPSSIEGNINGFFSTEEE